MTTNGGYRSSAEDTGVTERVVRISRVAKVTKGGRHLSFSAIVVVGDKEGQVGIGLGKADAVPDAVKKGSVKARKGMISVPLKGNSIPHEITAKYGAAEVMMRPATAGTGVIAGGSVRAIVELAGIKDIVTKARRSTNPLNTTKAAIKALSMLRDPETELAARKHLVDNPPPKRQPQTGPKRRQE